MIFNFACLLSFIWKVNFEQLQVTSATHNHKASEHPRCCLPPTSSSPLSILDVPTILSWWAARALVCAFLEQSHTHSIGQRTGPVTALFAWHMLNGQIESGSALWQGFCVAICVLREVASFSHLQVESVLLTLLHVFLFPMYKPLLFCKPSYETSIHERGFSSTQKHEKTLKNIEWSSQVQIPSWMFQHVLICELHMHMHVTLHSRQHQTYLAYNFTAFFAMFLCIRDDFVLDETISKTLAKATGLVSSLSAWAQMYNLLNKGSLALPQATLASLLCCQGRKETLIREKCAQMKRENIGDKSKLWQTDAERLIAFYLHAWNTHLHIKRSLGLYKSHVLP